MNADTGLTPCTPLELLQTDFNTFENNDGDENNPPLSADARLRLLQSALDCLQQNTSTIPPADMLAQLYAFNAMVTPHPSPLDRRQLGIVRPYKYGFVVDEDLPHQELDKLQTGCATAVSAIAGSVWLECIGFTKSCLLSRGSSGTISRLFPLLPGVTEADIAVDVLIFAHKSVLHVQRHCRYVDGTCDAFRNALELILEMYTEHSGTRKHAKTIRVVEVLAAAGGCRKQETRIVDLIWQLFGETNEVVRAVIASLFLSDKCAILEHFRDSLSMWSGSHGLGKRRRYCPPVVETDAFSWIVCVCRLLVLYEVIEYKNVIDVEKSYGSNRAAVVRLVVSLRDLFKEAENMYGKETLRAKLEEAGVFAFVERYGGDEDLMIVLGERKVKVAKIKKAVFQKPRRRKK